MDLDFSVGFLVDLVVSLGFLVDLALDLHLDNVVRDLEKCRTPRLSLDAIATITRLVVSFPDPSNGSFCSTRLLHVHNYLGCRTVEDNNCKLNCCLYILL